jgi:hypothetical protein
MPTPFPLVLTHVKDLFYLPVLHYLMCVLIVQRGSTLIFHTCIYCAVIRWTPITYSSLLPWSPLNSLQCIVLCYIIHRCNVAMFQYFSLSKILCPSSPLIVLSDRPTNTMMLSLSVYIYIYIYEYIHKIIYVVMCTFIL